jgi:hypothetical protein
MAVSEDEIIEQIAIRWFRFDMEPDKNKDGVWEKQPDSVKTGFRNRARIFWDNPRICEVRFPEASDDFPLTENAAEAFLLMVRKLEGAATSQVARMKDIREAQRKRDVLSAGLAPDQFRSAPNPYRRDPEAIIEEELPVTEAAPEPEPVAAPPAPAPIASTGFAVRVTTIDDVRPHGENLSIVTVAGNEVVANRKEDGSFRWAAGQACVYVPEGALVPEDVLKERGYWDDVKGKGLLDGNKGNRTKMRRFAGHESRGLLFAVDTTGGDSEDYPYELTRGEATLSVDVDHDVAEFLGITEHKAG